MNPSKTKTCMTFLKRLSRAGELRYESASPHGPLAIITSQGNLTMEREWLDELIAREAVTVSNTMARKTQKTRTWIKRHLSQSLEITTPESGIVTKSICENDGKRRAIQINTHESPLSRLANRKKNDGQKFITESEFAAGEQLRRDFEFAGLRPSVTANWEVVGSGAKSSGYVWNDIDPRQFSMDAKSRLNKALNHLGPDLSGVALDVCCFLKNLTLVETERQWPRRSAKIMLKAALAQLARHYGLDPNPDPRKGHGSAKIRHWHTSDFRPKIQ